MRWPLKPKYRIVLRQSTVSPLRYYYSTEEVKGESPLLAFQTFGVAWVQEEPPPPRYYLPCSFFPNTNDFAYLLQRHP